MKSLRRPVVYQGVTYPNYEIDFYTSNTYSKKSDDKILKPTKFNTGYLGYNFSQEGHKTQVEQHKVFAETFQDLLSKSPLVSHYSLQIGQDRHKLKTPTGFTFICNQVCPDHIDGDRANNHHTNLMIVTQSENNIKCGPRMGKKYKNVLKEKRCFNSWQSRIKFSNILYKNGKYFSVTKNFKTEEEAVLAYDTMLEESMLTIWGPDLGPKMYDFAYKNVIETPVQEELFV